MTAKSSVPIITVDGPSGSGKGTLCLMLAQKYGFPLLDSGALYRVTAVAATEAGVDYKDEAKVAELARRLEVTFAVESDTVKVLLAGRDVSAEIRTEQAGMGASAVAALPRVRQALLQRQRDFDQAPGVVADGRDMGTVVFPNAQVKIFLTASAQERATRRLRQLQEKSSGNGELPSYQAVLADIEKRDEQDRNRSVSPLTPADNALVIDSTQLSIEEVFERICKQIDKVVGR